MNSRNIQIRRGMEPTFQYTKGRVTRNHNLGLMPGPIKVSTVRKSRIFIKSRFSRNRQSCRPIVYWSLWMNVLFIGFSQIKFYGFKFSTGYIPWTLIVAGIFFIAQRFVSRSRYKPTL